MFSTHVVAAGLNTVDSADVYSAWVRGNIGCESETIIFCGSIEAVGDP
jgi:aryl-alcohol dehydrogenase-like predicted oxidoreductase